MKALSHAQKMITSKPHSQWLSVGSHACGRVAIGISAHGIIAIGICAHGVVSIGVIAMGVFSVGLVSMGLVSTGLVAMGLENFNKNHLEIVKPFNNSTQHFHPHTLPSSKHEH